MKMKSRIIYLSILIIISFLALLFTFGVVKKLKIYDIKRLSFVPLRVFDIDSPLQNDYVDGEIIIKFKTEIGEQILKEQERGYETRDAVYNVYQEVFNKCNIVQIESVLKTRLIRRQKESTLDNLYKIETNDDVLAKCNELSKDPNVEYAEPNYIYRLCVFPETLPDDTYVDPDGDGMWSTGNLRQGSDYEDLWGVKQLEVHEAWAISQGEDIVVAVTDSGIDYNHEDLSENIWINAGEDINNNGIVDEEDSDGIDNDDNGYIDDIRGWNFSDNNNDPMDDYYHGSFCAGIIGAIGNNNKGIIGVAPKVKLMAVKVFNNEGNSSLAGLVNSIKYAADNGARIISASWIGAKTQTLLDTVHYAYYEKRCIVVAAAGNNNNDASFYYPAGIGEVITVSSMGPFGERSSFSSWGSIIDVIAPGEHILSVNSERAIYDGLENDPNYRSDTGTSMACPYITGLAALILAKDGSFTNEQVNQIIRVSANPLGDTEERDIYAGYGLPNVPDALLVNSALACRITHPETGTTISSLEGCDIKGIVDGLDFQSYSLEYRIKGEEGWNPIIENDTNPHPDYADRENFETLGTFTINGDYDIRLTARDSNGNIFEDQIKTTIDIIGIDLGKEIYNNSETIVVKGSVTSPLFISYRLEWGVGENPVEWRNDGITLEDDGLSQVYNGILGTLDLDDEKIFSVSGWYTMRLCVADENYTVEEARSFYIDPEVLSGWPQGSGAGILGIDEAEYNSYPVIGEIDEDVYLEVVWTYVDAYNIHTSKLFGELREINIGGNYRYPANIPTLINLNEDTSLEIVVPTNSGKIAFIDIDNTLDVKYVSNIWDSEMITIDGIAVDLKQHPVIVNDLDNDGDLEVIAIGYICRTHTFYLYVWDFNTMALIFRADIEDRIVKDEINVALGDLNGNGDKEIILGMTRITDRAGIFYVFNINGEIISGPVFLLEELDERSGREELNKIVTVDINGDNISEILIGTNCNVYAMDIDGNILWQEGISKAEYLTIADIDNNGLLEIITGSYDVKIIRLNEDGDIHELKTVDLGNIGYIYGVSVADIDNDGELDMIVSGLGVGETSHLYTHRVIVVDILKYNMETDTYVIDNSYYRYAPSYVPDAPGIPFDNVSLPFINDIDRDGDTDIGIAYTYSNGETERWGGKLRQKYLIQIWDNNGIYRPSNIRWQYRNYSLENTSCYSVDFSRPTTPVVTVKDYTSPSIIYAYWHSSDPESGIVEYWYSIGTIEGASDVVPWTCHGEVSSVRREDLNLSSNQCYYVNVKAINGVGMWSKVGTSDAIRVDATPPTRPIVDDDGEYTSNNTSLTATWASSDPETPIVEYLYQVTMGGTDTKDWTYPEPKTATSTTINGLSLVGGQTYYISVKAMNAAGLWSDVVSSDGITVNISTLPTPIVIDEGDYKTNGTPITTTWHLPQESESSVVGYEYYIRGDNGTVLQDWQATTSNFGSSGMSMLEEGVKYYFNVRSINNTGTKSPIGSSDGITIDTEGPKIINETDSRQNEPKIYAKVSDASSGLKDVYVLIRKASGWKKELMDYNYATDTYEEPIPTRPKQKLIIYKIGAIDNAGNVYETRIYYLWLK